MSQICYAPWMWLLSPFVLSVCGFEWFGWRVWCLEIGHDLIKHDMALNHTLTPANGSAVWRRGPGETSKGQTDLTSLCHTRMCSSAWHAISVCFCSKYGDHNPVCIFLSSIRISSFVSSVSLVEDALQGLLEFLTSSRCSPTQHLEQEQALARQFAEILHFTLRFDELKVTRQPLVTPIRHMFPV